MFFLLEKMGDVARVKVGVSGANQFEVTNTFKTVGMKW